MLSKFHTATPALSHRPQKLCLRETAKRAIKDKVIDSLVKPLNAVLTNRADRLWCAVASKLCRTLNVVPSSTIRDTLVNHCNFTRTPRQRCRTQRSLVTVQPCSAMSRRRFVRMRRDGDLATNNRPNTDRRTRAGDHAYLQAVTTESFSRSGVTSLHASA